MNYAPSPRRQFLAGPLLGLMLFALPSAAQSTFRVSVDSAGAQANNDSGFYRVSITADGRFVAFDSVASNLVAGDTNASADVFLHDNWSGTTERVSVDSFGAQGNSDSTWPSLSADGRFVAFESSASNLVPGDTNGKHDVFVRDRVTGITERVSVDGIGSQGNAHSYWPSISANGDFVAFVSDASNLVAGDTNGWGDVFVRDRTLGTTERVSVDSAGAQGMNISDSPSISADGNLVAFASWSETLVTGDTNVTKDIFVHDRQSGATELASVSTSGAQGNYPSDQPSISADGRFVAFCTNSSTLVSGDTNIVEDVFVRDLQAGTTERVSISTSGAQASTTCAGPSMSADGRFVVFHTGSNTLVGGDTNGSVDVFLRDRLNGTTSRVSVDSAGGQVSGNSDKATLSADAGVVAFRSFSGNMVPNDTNGWYDVFVRDRGTASPGTDLCQPGSSGSIPCPCANPAASSPRGCDNSFGTGGAQITSSGRAWLAGDTVVFATNGQTPSSTSIVLQGNAGITTGVAFGQGVRCVGGTLKRLYMKTASGGSMTAPAPGDPPVSVRSGAVGDAIPAGGHRWYAVYYRDPVVLGGCPATSGFNVTQTQAITWNL